MLEQLLVLMLAGIELLWADHSGRGKIMQNEHFKGWKNLCIQLQAHHWVVYESGSTRDFITDTFTIELKDGPELFTFNSKGVINIQKAKNMFPVNGGIFGEDTIVGRLSKMRMLPPILADPISIEIEIIISLHQYCVQISVVMSQWLSAQRSDQIILKPGCGCGPCGYKTIALRIFSQFMSHFGKEQSEITSSAGVSVTTSNIMAKPMGVNPITQWPPVTGDPRNASEQQQQCPSISKEVRLEEDRAGASVPTDGSIPESQPERKEETVAWEYKQEEVDHSVFAELPSEIQQELQGRMGVQSNKRGKPTTIAEFMLLHGRVTQHLLLERKEILKCLAQIGVTDLSEENLVKPSREIIWPLYENLVQYLAGIPSGEGTSRYRDDRIQQLEETRIQIVSEKASVSQMKQEGFQLRTQIVQSPDKLRKMLEDRRAAVQNAEAEVESARQSVEEAQAKRKVQKCLDMMDSLNKQAALQKKMVKDSKEMKVKLKENEEKHSVISVQLALGQHFHNLLEKLDSSFDVKCQETVKELEDFRLQNAPLIDQLDKQEEKIARKQDEVEIITSNLNEARSKKEAGLKAFHDEVELIQNEWTFHTMTYPQYDARYRRTEAFQLCVHVDYFDRTVGMR
ncbi:hypothetical protein SELMODRAFT_448933 [Selaginella moellendorffii]|uniref:Kinetochore protein Nuf2 N-terminal domain-containing protein n=1 Tax=Selaginella moellendorffii TaxID=88036 RepID=D8TBA2_SELML|nr:hypothetical protein SELMODRAFT_448933 [Selaginella moellendorffii]